MSPEKTATDQVEEASNFHGAEAAFKGNGPSHGREVEPSSSAPGQTKCSICQSTFRRPEHLKRHFRSHTKEKPFECAQCGRHFSRTDTLHRHELSHHTIGTDGGKDRTHRITVKTFRACFKCALARVRCSGGMPCTRCETRSLECQYPTERRSKAKMQKRITHEKEGTPSGTTSQSRSTLSMEGTQASRKKDDEDSSFRTYGYQMGQFQLQISGFNNSSTPSPDTSVSRPRGYPQKLSEDREGVRATTASNPALRRSDAAGVSEAIPRRVSSFADVNQQYYPHIPNSQGQNPFSVGQRRRPSHLLGGQQTVVNGPGNVASELAGTENQHVQLGFSQPLLLDQPTIPTINWLSNDLFLESAPDSGLPSGPSPLPLQARVFDGSFNHTTWLPPVINTEHNNSSLSGNGSQTPSRNTSLASDVDGQGRLAPGLAPQSESSKRRTDYSADELSDRLLKNRRKQSSWTTQTAESLDIFLKFQNNDSKPRFAFPMLQEVKPDIISDVSVDYLIQPSTYNQIHNAFIQLCFTDNFLYAKFETDKFPNAHKLSSFLRLYFHFFHPIYPIFHTPTFNPNRCHWIVTLALAAIGSHSASLCEQNGTVMAFHEFLRRAICVEKEKSRSERTPLWLLQVLLLNCIGRLHGSSERGRLSALSDFSDLTILAAPEKLLCCPDNSNHSNESSPEQQWISWVEEESRRRTGYAIWLVDCISAYHFDSKPHFSLDDGQAVLPSHEKLWEASSSQSWKGLSEDVIGQERVSLHDAVLILYIEKRLVSGIGEFSHVLLIHALYHRMWEVGDYFRRPLSFWNPTAKKQSRKLAIPSGSVWLPGIPSYSKWRNSACDCLDILHWTANGTIARANGFEHPTILYLHTARIILLAPFREIRLLVNLLATQKFKWNDRQQVIEWHYILRWIKHDQYKARLAVIHSGSVLYHIRRYSTNAFHEPVAAYLAILTLWAYGLCYKQASPDLTTSTGSRSERSDEPAIITLDQPCSDELVQHFVREGQTMKAMLTGVGEFCAPHCPEQILRVGCETLAGLTSWGIAKEFMVTLMRLVELIS